MRELTERKIYRLVTKNMDPVVGIRAIQVQNAIKK